MTLSIDEEKRFLSLSLCLFLTIARRVGLKEKSIFSSPASSPLLSFLPPFYSFKVATVNDASPGKEDTLANCSYEIPIGSWEGLSDYGSPLQK